jgi:hypothetical protein
MNTKYIKSGCFEIALTTDKSGRTSIVVRNENTGSEIIDAELPAQKGEYKDSFRPTIKVTKEFEVNKYLIS